MKSVKMFMVSVLALALAFAAVSPAAWASGGLAGATTVGVFPSIDLASYGAPLSDAEMEATEGEVGPLVAGAVVGAASTSAAYLVSSDNPTVGGFVQAAAEGAAYGLIGGAFATIKAVATSAPLVIQAADVVWGVWTGASVGATKGAIDKYVLGNR